MIPLISEHDTWISLDPIIGCPAGCSYCFVQRIGEMGNRPERRATPIEALNAVESHIAEDLRFYEGERQRMPRIVCLGNYTDMFMTPQNREYVLEYTCLHHEHLPEIPLVLSTKAVLDQRTLDGLDAIGHTILLFISQSFLGWYGSASVSYEIGVASPEESCENLQMVAASENLKPLHFWRPVTRISLADETAVLRQLRIIRDAGATASVAVGLKYGEFLRPMFAAPSSPYYAVLQEQQDSSSPVGEVFPYDLRELVLRVARAEDYPVYLNTSCAVSYALRIPEFLQTFRPPVQQFRCEPACCPSRQRAICFGVKKQEPNGALLGLISEQLMLPAGAIKWEKDTQAIAIQSWVTQETQCRLAHVTGFRIRPIVVGATREWVGAFSGPNPTMSPTGLKVEIQESQGGEIVQGLINRLARVTGMLSPIGPQNDDRATVFNRYSHVRRVATVAVSVANIIMRDEKKLSIEYVRRLAWLHDLNRWPFAHNSESGHFNQSSDIRPFFLANAVDLGVVEESDLVNIHLRAQDSLSLEGLIVLVADQVTGITEDTLLAITALGITPAFIPRCVTELTGLPLSDSGFQGRLWDVRQLYLRFESRLVYSSILDQIIIGYALDAITRRCCFPPVFKLGARLSDRIAEIRIDFLNSILFPLVNEHIGHAEFLKTRIITPLIDYFGDEYVRSLTMIDDLQAIGLAVEHGFIQSHEIQQAYADLDYVQHNMPDAYFHPVKRE